MDEIEWVEGPEELLSMKWSGHCSRFLEVPKETADDMKVLSFTMID